MCPDLPAEMKPLPSSPQLADSPLKAAEPFNGIEENTGCVDGLQDDDSASVGDSNDVKLVDDMETSCDVEKVKPETMSINLNKQLDFLDLIEDWSVQQKRVVLHHSDTDKTETYSEMSENSDHLNEHQNSYSTTLEPKNLTEFDRIHISVMQDLEDQAMPIEIEKNTNEMNAGHQVKNVDMNTVKEIKNDPAADGKTNTVGIVMSKTFGSGEIEVCQTEQYVVSAESITDTTELNVCENENVDEIIPIGKPQNLEIPINENAATESKVSQLKTDEITAEHEREAYKMDANQSEQGDKMQCLSNNDTADTESAIDNKINETGNNDDVVSESHTVESGENSTDCGRETLAASESLESNKMSGTDEMDTGYILAGDCMTSKIVEAGEIPVNMSANCDVDAVSIDSTREGQGEPSDKHLEDDVVWICFVCAKEFPNQGELMTHQNNCEDSGDDQYVPMEMDSMDIPAGNVIDLQPLGLVSNTVESDITVPNKTPDVLDQSASSACGKSGQLTANFPVLCGQLQAPELEADITGAPVTSTSSVSVSKPVPTLLTKVGSQFKSLPLGLPLSRKRKHRKWPEVYIPPPPEVYFNSLGLGPTRKVKEIQETPKKLRDGCDIIDLTVEESQPMTPRTPRSLMSQWSRDEASGRRRQLSFTQNSQQEVEKEEEEDSSSDSDNSERSQEERVPKRNVPCKSTIYAIPLTSPLGQRLKKNWQNENHVPVVSDIEKFCRTSGNNNTVNSPSRDVMVKLRHRPPPQITFRFTKRYINKYHHSYKFNSVDRREFQKKLKTGLERVSRQLLKQMKPCKVVLSRVSKKDIKYWTTRGQRIRNEYYMNQMQQHLKQKILLEQQKVIKSRYPHTGMLNQTLVVLNNGQIQNQTGGIQQLSFPTQFKFIGNHQHPTPQLLVPHQAGFGGKLLLPASNNHVPPPAAPVRREITGSQKRKQDFSNVRVDDEISITILSSDEEEEESCSKSQNCHCTACQNKRRSAIKPKPKIGPASFKRKEAMRNQIQFSSGASQCKLPVSAQKERFVALVNNDSAISRSKQGGVSLNPEFMNFRMVNGQIQSLKPASGFQVLQQNPVPHSPLILNKSIIKRPFIQSQPGSRSSTPGSPVKGPCSPVNTAPGSPVKGPCSPIKIGTGAHVHKDNDLGFEVIMIDSDDED